MKKLRNNGRLHRFPRGAAENWPHGVEREVSDDVAAKLLESGHFSVVAMPLVQVPAVVAPVTKTKPKRRRKKPAKK